MRTHTRKGRTAAAISSALTVAAALAVLLTGCSTSKDIKNPGTVAPTTTATARPPVLAAVDKLDNTKTFRELLKYSGVLDTLDPATEYTMVVPTDEAFKTLGVVTTEELFKNRDTAAGVVRLHIIPGVLNGETLAGGKGCVETLGGLISLGTTEDGTPKIGNAPVTGADKITPSGAIHVVSSVNTAPTPECETGLKLPEAPSSATTVPVPQ